MVHVEGTPIPYIIWDIDNVLADDSWRVGRIDMSQPDPDARYEEYHAGIPRDPVHAAGQTIFERKSLAGFPLFVTARPEPYREATRLWLERELKVPFQHTGPGSLLMRPVGDHEHSAGLKVRLVQQWLAAVPGARRIVAAYDDRRDVLDAYRAAGITAVCGHIAVHDDYPPHQPAVELLQAGATLRIMADTFEERQTQYKSNYLAVAGMMAALFPDGAPPKLLHDPRFHLFELICVKLSRYAIANFEHQDSIHDAGVYAAMCEALGNQ